MIDYEGMILAHQDLYQILDDVGGAICCGNCAKCVFNSLYGCVLNNYVFEWFNEKGELRNDN